MEQLKCDNLPLLAKLFYNFIIENGEKNSGKHKNL